MQSIEDEAAMEAALASPLALVVKDSPRCIQCAVVRRQLRKLEKRLAREDRPVEIYLLNVLDRRGLSDELAARFDVRHESPQAFVLKYGKLLWHGSHFALTWRRLASEIARA